MRHTLKLLLFLLLTMISSARTLSQVDHLEPTESYFSAWGFMDEYHSNCRKILYKGLQKYFEIRVVVLSSSPTEYLLSIEKRNHQSCLILKQPSREIWNSLDLANIKTVEKIIRIDSILINYLKQVFKKFILNSSYAKTTNRCEADGIEFQFITFENEIGQITGRTWSCAESKKLNTLMEMVALLRKSIVSNSLKTHRKAILDRCMYLLAVK